MAGISREPSSEPVERGLPRAVDVVLALAGLIVSLPVLVVAGLWVALSSKGPVIFRQERVGRNGSRFVLLKLRSMAWGAGGPEITAGNDRRVTPAGRVLRKTKIDELPQLWNVLRGEMALVGPRPEVPAYVDLEDPAWRRVLETRPGITDPVSLRLRFEEDLLAAAPGDRAEFYRAVFVPFKIYKYLEYQSVRTSWSDLEVLLQTLLAGFFRDGAPLYRLEDLNIPLKRPIH